MDYAFKKDFLGQPIAKFSFGHEAIGRWLTEEIGHNYQKALSLLATIRKIEQSEIGFKDVQGLYFQLSLSMNGVEVSMIDADFQPEDDDNESFDLYHSESHSECGLQDFKQSLQAWIEFID